MTEQQLQAIVVEAIAEEVIRRLQKKLAEARKKALVVCTGSGLLFPVWSAALQRLESEGFVFDLLLSRGAWQAFDVDALMKAVSFGKLMDGETENYETLAYPTVIVPAMTINTAAKIAACTADTPASRIIFTSMMRGRDVIISVDGCCPDNPARLEKGYIFTEPLKEQLRANILRLKDFGAVLTTADALADRTLRLISPREERQVYTAERKVVGRSEIFALPEGAVLRIPHGSMLTQLAKDVARERGVVIENEV